MSTTHAAAVSTGVVASYLGLYSAYDKATKDFNFGLVQKILSFSDLDYTARQLNKVVGLSSLTIAGVALTPGKLSDGAERPLLRIASGMGLAHFVASAFLFYGFNPLKMLKGEGKGYRFEIPALVSGSGALYLMCEESIKSDSIADIRARASFAAIFLAVLHFFYIETKTGLPQDLPVRPYGYTAFIAPLTALGYPHLSDIACYLTGRLCRILSVVGVTSPHNA